MPSPISHHFVPNYWYRCPPLMLELWLDRKDDEELKDDELKCEAKTIREKNEKAANELTLASSGGFPPNA